MCGNLVKIGTFSLGVIQGCATCTVKKPGDLYIFHLYLIQYICLTCLVQYWMPLYIFDQVILDKVPGVWKFGENRHFFLRGHARLCHLYCKKPGDLYIFHLYLIQYICLTCLVQYWMLL